MNIHDDGVLQAKWRVGRGGGGNTSAYRAIYAMVSDLPLNVDVFIGIMDERRDAEHIVELHNRSIETTDAAPRRCLECEPAGIQCYRTDEHTVHRGYHPAWKVWVTWPVSRPYEQLTEQEGGPPNERING